MTVIDIILILGSRPNHLCEVLNKVPIKVPNEVFTGLSNSWTVGLRVCMIINQPSMGLLIIGFQWSMYNITKPLTSKCLQFRSGVNPWTISDFLPKEKL